MADGYYTIVAPGTIHPNTQYNVVASVKDVEDVCKMKLTLKGPNFEKIKEIEVPPKMAINVGFEIPNIESGDYTLNVEGVSGLVFTKDSTLDYADNKPSIFIQTDKAKYKPNDLVQFRVVCLDNNIRPSNIDKITIIIKDAAKNRIKQFSNVTLTKGVISEKLQLSEFPVLGEWQIEVQVNGEPLESKSFDVEEYVLPKFEVIVDVPKKSLLSDEKFVFTVRSKYTFGKSIKGKAKIKFTSRTAASHGHHSYPIQPFRRQPGFIRNDDFDHYHNFGYSDHVIEKEVQKTIDIDGKAVVEFDIDDIKPGSLVKPNEMKSKVTAIVEDELTGNKQTGTAELKFVWNRFDIQAPHMHLERNKTDKTFTYSVTVTDFDNVPITDNKHPVKLSIHAFSEVLKESFLNEHGIASFELDGTGEWNYLPVDIEYLDQKANGSITRIVSSTPTGDFLEVMTKNHQVGNQVEIEINSNDIIMSFVYVIVARGNIIHSAFVDMTDKITKKHRFSIEARPDMMPNSRIYAYYLHDKDLKFFETSFDVEAKFMNKISIGAPERAQPGDDVAIQVSTNDDSYVGLMAVDQSVLLLKSGNDFDKENLLNSLSNLTSETPHKYMNSQDPYPGGQSGLITVTNASYPCRPFVMYTCTRNLFGGAAGFASVQSESLQSFSAPMMKRAAFASPALPPQAMQPPRIRKDFSESWFFADFPNFSEKDLTIVKKIPDTITSWIISGFSLNPRTGFALTELPAKVQTFRPFFVSTNLPYSVKRGEVVAIPVLVFNYMEKSLEVTITFDNSDEEFKFMDEDANQKQRVKIVNVEPNNVELLNFVIRPERIGLITLKITALSSIAGDAIHKKLKVDPEGITVFENRDFYVQTTEEKTFNEKLVLDIPNEVVPDSEHIEISLMGDILSSTVCNFDKLVRMPYGCGEQNMVNFVPNILILMYLESIDQLNPAIETKAKRYMEIGYQRELTYKHDDGSYSAFGKSDKCGSTWLTAYVVRSFRQATRYIDIDTKLLIEGLEFLANLQAPNGSFPEKGKLFDFSHHNEVGLTAFVMLAFLENNDLASKYQDNIEKGFRFLEENTKQMSDLYATSIALYALQLHKSNVANEIFAKIEADAKSDGGRKWWSKSATKKHLHSWRSESHDVEITGYILMSLLDKNESVLPIIKWLISQRNSNGGFESTQETVVGLQALVKFAERSGAAGANLTIDFEAGGKDKPAYASQIESKKNSSLEMITHVLPGWVREVAVTGKGSGTAVLQISYRYNVALKDEKPSFDLKTEIQPKSNVQKLHLNVTAEYKPEESDAQQSNMVVMEVNLPSGYTANVDAFDNIKKIENVKRVDTKNGDTSIVIYFDGLEAGKVANVPVEAERAHEVSEQKPVPIVIYDYYDNLKRATVFYKV